MPAARTAILLLISAVLALGAAGCGGSEVEYEEVPGAPAGVPIPDDTSSLGTDSADPADPDAAATPTPEAGAVAPDDQSGAAGTDTAATTTPPPPAAEPTDPATTDSGGSTAPTDADGPANDTAPPEGSEAQEFEAFCAENPGAC